MTVHLLKPALGIQDIYDLQIRQKSRIVPYRKKKLVPIWTSRRPNRLDELLDGGSLFWIVKNHIQCRQPILEFEILEGEEDKPSYLFLCAPQLVRTLSIERKAFQGWRYLEPANAPPDIGPVHEDKERPPPEMEKDLKSLGLL